MIFGSNATSPDFQSNFTTIFLLTLALTGQIKHLLPFLTPFVQNTLYDLLHNHLNLSPLCKRSHLLQQFTKGTAAAISFVKQVGFFAIGFVAGLAWIYWLKAPLPVCSQDQHSYPRII